MPKYIDAEKLIAELNAGGMPIREQGLSWILGDLSSIQDYIDAAPSEDVAPVRHGEWSDKMIVYRAPSDIPEHGDLHFGFKCSLCGAILNKTPYCGNCGALMDGKVNEKGSKK